MLMNWLNQFTQTRKDGELMHPFTESSVFHISCHAISFCKLTYYRHGGTILRYNY